MDGLQSNAIAMNANVFRNMCEEHAAPFGVSSYEWQKHQWSSARIHRCHRCNSSVKHVLRGYTQSQAVYVDLSFPADVPLDGSNITFWKGHRLAVGRLCSKGHI